MSLTCNRTDLARYLALTSSNRRRTTRTATGTTSGSAAIDERWVALNKSTFLDILNEILCQSAIPTPEMTSQVSIEDRSPKYVCMDDHPLISGRTTQMNCDTLFSNDYTSGLPRYSEYTTTSPFVRCGQSIECEPVNIRASGSGWNNKSQPTSSLPVQRLSPDMEVATDLTTVDRRRPQAEPGHSTEQIPRSSSSCSSHWQVDETDNMYSSLFERSESPQSVDDICLQSPEHSSTSADGMDDRSNRRSLSWSQDASDIDELCDDMEQQSSLLSASLSPHYFNTPSTTGATNQSSSSCCSVSNQRKFTSGTNAEVSGGESRASWMVIDKTLLCDVVDHMLYHDMTFGFPERHDTTLPFPVDRYFTDVRSDRWSRSKQVMTAASTERRFRHGDTLHSLLKSDSPRPEPETPLRSPVTSSVCWHHTGGSNKGYRSKKRSTHATTDLPGKRRCQYSDCRNVFPFPMYVKTQHDDMKCADDDDRTSGNTAHSPTLKWKSTMLLRMRCELETSGNCSPVTAT